MASANSKIPVILMAFANDDARSLRQLDEEQRELKRIFELVWKEGKCEIEVLPAATTDDVLEAFLKYRQRIRIFHYGGHSDADAIFFKDTYQRKQGIQAENLAQFLALQPGLELIFLNSCLSLPQAQQYQETGAKVVLATSGKISDKAARRFAHLFYTAFAAGADILEAYQKAESGFQVNPGESSSRGIGLEEKADELPWQLFPQAPVSPWRLPAVAKHLTRIPTIDLAAEFIGREKDMERLKETLERSTRVILMNGLGGIGKTVLATAYVQQHGDSYDHVVWLNRGEDLIKAIALNEELADTLDIPLEEGEELEARFRRILWKLQQLPGRNLLMIDNAQEQIAQAEVYDLLPGAPNWRVLVTSRLQLSGFEQLSLGTLEPEAARKLFQTYYQGTYTEVALEELLQEIGYHTLTIELLGKLLDKLNNLLSVAELTEIMRQKQLNDPDLQETIWARHSGAERGIYLHLMKAFELTKLGEREIGLLKQFVVLPVERYTPALLADLLQEKPLGLNKDLNSLAAKGWLTRHEDKTFSMHRLIRQVAEYQLQPSFKDVEVLTTAMIRKMSVDDYTSRVTATAPWINYAINIESYFTGEKQARLVTLQNEIALTYRDLGQYREALRYLSKVLAIQETEPATNDLNLATSYNNIAAIYLNLGRYEEALDFQQKALAIRESLLEAKHPQLAIAYNTIASIYRALGKYSDALDYFYKNLHILEYLLEGNHPQIAIAYNNIAETYRSSGRYQEALHYHQQALAILETVLEANHPNLAIAYNNIGLSYLALGQYPEALSYQQKALVIQESVLQANHPDLAQSYSNIAETYRALGIFSEALSYQQKDLAILEEVLEANHPDLATSYNNIAVIYSSIGHHKEALGYHQKALAIRQVALEADHPDLAQSLNNIGITYCHLQLFEEALPYQHQALVIMAGVLDSDHPDLATSYNNIAVTYRSLGYDQEALDYMLESLAIREAVLGANHPSLATSYNNIASIFSDYGQHEAVLNYLEKSLAIWVATLEADHPQLGICYNNIAITYRALGQDEQAEMYQAKADTIKEKEQH